MQIHIYDATGVQNSVIDPGFDSLPVSQITGEPPTGLTIKVIAHHPDNTRERTCKTFVINQL